MLAHLQGVRPHGTLGGDQARGDGGSVLGKVGCRGEIRDVVLVTEAEGELLEGLVDDLDGDGLVVQLRQAVGVVGGLDARVRGSGQRIDLGFNVFHGLHRIEEVVVGVVEPEGQVDLLGQLVLGLEIVGVVGLAQQVGAQGDDGTDALLGQIVVTDGDAVRTIQAEAERAAVIDAEAGGKRIAVVLKVGQGGLVVADDVPAGRKRDGEAGILAVFQGQARSHRPRGGGDGVGRGVKVVRDIQRERGIEEDVRIVAELDQGGRREEVGGTQGRPDSHAGGGDKKADRGHSGRGLNAD